MAERLGVEGSKCEEEELGTGANRQISENVLRRAASHNLDSFDLVGIDKDRQSPESRHSQVSKLKSIQEPRELKLVQMQRRRMSNLVLYSSKLTRTKDILTKTLFPEL